MVHTGLIALLFSEWGQIACNLRDDNKLCECYLSQLLLNLIKLASFGSCSVQGRRISAWNAVYGDGGLHERKSRRVVYLTVYETR